MIDQLILVAVILGLLVYHYYFAKQAKEERKELINAIVAKNAVELRDLKMADNTKIKLEPPPSPDEVPLESLSAEDHYKAIIKQASERTEE